MDNLANLHNGQGRPEAALPLYERALAGQEAALGRGHQDTLLTVGNLGLCHRAMGNEAQAEPLLRRAADGLREALGPDHPHARFYREELGS